jgi:hypothetical protein
VGREVLGSDEASQMWQRLNIVCRGEDGLKDTARGFGQTASIESNSEVAVTSVPDLQA